MDPRIRFMKGGPRVPANGVIVRSIPVYHRSNNARMPGSSSPSILLESEITGEGNMMTCMSFLEWCDTGEHICDGLADLQQPAKGNSFAHLDSSFPLLPAGRRRPKTKPMFLLEGFYGRRALVQTRQHGARCGLLHHSTLSFQFLRIVQPFSPESRRDDPN